MSWFIDGAAGTRPVHAHGEPRPWLPTSWTIDEAQGAAGSETGAIGSNVPPLAFDEGEMARVAAAVRLGVERETRAACAAQPAAQQADALDRLARSLRAAIAEQQVEADATTRRVALLAEAIGCAAAADPPGERRRVRAVVTGIIAAVAPAPLGLRLVLDPDATDLLRPMLPEISSQTGLAGSIELTADPALPVGGVQLLWSGGWLEHDPATIAGRISELMAPSLGGDAPATPIVNLEVTADDDRPA